jgi:hypothetical protein
MADKRFFVPEQEFPALSRWPDPAMRRREPLEAADAAAAAKQEIEAIIAAALARADRPGATLAAKHFAVWAALWARYDQFLTDEMMDALGPACHDASIQLMHQPVYAAADVKFKLLAAQAEIRDCLQLAFEAESQAMNLLNAAIADYSRVFASLE